MSDQNILGIGFLEKEPKSAARVLDEIEARDAAAFLDLVPVRLATPVMRAMGPWQAARCLGHMSRAVAGTLIAAMPHVEAVSLLRLIEASARHEILEFTSESFRRSFQRAISYRRDTVGAWTDLSTPSFDANSDVGSALRTIRRMQFAHSHLFLTNTSRRYVGAVSVLDLLRHPESTTLASVANRSVRPLSNQAPLSNYNNSPLWDELSTLPVVGRGQNFLGGLRQSELRRGLSEPVMSRREIDHGTFATELASAFVAVAAQCANLALATPQEKREIRPEDK